MRLFLRLEYEQKSRAKMYKLFNFHSLFPNRAYQSNVYDSGDILDVVGRRKGKAFCIDHASIV